MTPAVEAVAAQLAGRRVITASRLDRLARSGARVVALAFWIVLPVLCAVMLVFGTEHLSRHLNNMPPGILGSYTVTSHSCSGEVCVTGGTFSSSDGRIVEKNLLGVYSWQDGETHKAIYDAQSVDVIPLPTHWDPTATVVGMTGALGFIVLWAVCLYGAIRRRLLARSGAWDVSVLD
jgi:hypothetical protein